MFRFLSQLVRNSDLKIVGRDELTSSDGWALRFVGNSPATWRLHYTDGNRELTIHVEALAGGTPVVWCADLSEIRGWESDGAFKPFSKEDRQRISRNIRRGMRALKHACKVKW